MSKGVLQDFYNSPKWRRCVAALRKEKDYTCEMCKEYGNIGHHTIPLTEENYTNPNISLNINLLMLLCTSCHNKIENPPPVEDGFMFDEYGNFIPIE